jgi:glyoxylase I family protein
VHAHHLAIRACDVSKVATFYREVLQLPVIDPPRPGVAWFRLGELILMIEPAAQETTANDATIEATGFHLLALAIDPRERATWEQRLHDHGVAIDNRSDYTLYIRDPEGNRVGLSHYPACAESA